MTKPTPLEELLLKLEGKLDEDLLEEVSDFLYEQEDEIKDRTLEISRLEDEVGVLEEQVSDLEDKDPDPLEYDVVARWLNHEATPKEKEDILQEFDTIAFLKLPHTLDSMVGIYASQLEEYINQHGVEDTLTKLTQDHSQEVEALRGKLADMEDDYRYLDEELSGVKDALEEANSKLSTVEWE